MAEKSGSEYTVGYGKPPQHAQFKPGQSGNPGGRPRKTSTFEDDVEAELRSLITVLERGERRRISKRRAIVKQHVNRALNGDVRSTELLLKLGNAYRPSNRTVWMLCWKSFAKNIAGYRRKTTNRSKVPNASI
jgi:Family of unknown function (DUF5681)